MSFNYISHLDSVLSTYTNEQLKFIMLELTKVNWSDDIFEDILAIAAYSNFPKAA